MVNHHHSRRGSRASPSRRSGRAPRALPWRSSPARSRASPLVDATLRVSPPGGVSQLRGRPETRGGCRSARTGTSLSSTSHPISKRPRLFSPPLRVQLVELEQATTRLHYSGMLQVEWQAHRQCIRVSAYVLRILEACRELNYFRETVFHGVFCVPRGFRCMVGQRPLVRARAIGALAKQRQRGAAPRQGAGALL